MKKKNWLLGVIAIGLFLISFGEAKRVPNPEIKFSEAFEDSLIGSINTYVDYSSRAKRKHYFLVNQAGEIAWENQDLVEPDSIESEFSFAIPSFVGGGLYEFHVVWLDEFNQKVTTTMKLVENTKSLNPENYLFDIIFPKDSEKGQLEVLFEEGLEDAKIQFEVRENSYFGEVVLSEIKNIEGKKTLLEFEVPIPPESYLFLVQIVDEEGKILTPKHQQRFLVPGNFAEITQVFPLSGTDLSSQSEVHIIGRGFAPQEGIYRLLMKGSDSDTGAFVREIPLEDTLSGNLYFETTLPLLGESEKIDLIFDVVDKDNNILDTKIYSYIKTPILKKQEVLPVIKEEFKIPFWAYLLAGVALLLFVGGLVIMHKKNQSPQK